MEAASTGKPGIRGQWKGRWKQGERVGGKFKWRLRMGECGRFRAGVAKSRLAAGEGERSIL
jgi:hypothetical protein